MSDDHVSAARETIAVTGDLHGHLQLALCMLARWQRELGERFEIVLLCGWYRTLATLIRSADLPPEEWAARFPS